MDKTPRKKSLTQIKINDNDESSFSGGKVSARVKTGLINNILSTLKSKTMATKRLDMSELNKEDA